MLLAEAIVAVSQQIPIDSTMWNGAVCDRCEEAHDIPLRDWDLFYKTAAYCLWVFGAKENLSESEMETLYPQLPAIRSKIFDESSLKLKLNPDLLESEIDGTTEHFSRFFVDNVNKLDSIELVERLQYIEYGIGFWLITNCLAASSVPEKLTTIAHVTGRHLFETYYRWFRDSVPTKS